MNLFDCAASGLTLSLTLTAVAGCSGNTALVGRENLPVRASSKASQPVQNEVVGTVESVDTASNEIHLRAGPGHPGMVIYGADTRVTYLGLVYPVSRLRIGDIIAMQMEKDSRGNPHTRMIRLQQSADNWAQRDN
jgi:hypothetical protein